MDVPNSNVATAQNGRRILRMRDVLRRVPLSRTQIWRKARANTFPRPIKLGDNAIGFFEDEIESWLASLPRAYARACTPEAA